MSVTEHYNPVQQLILQPAIRVTSFLIDSSSITTGLWVKNLNLQFRFILRTYFRLNNRIKEIKYMCIFKVYIWLVWVWELWYSEIICALSLLISMRCVNCSLSNWHVPVLKPLWAALTSRPQRTKQFCLQIVFRYTSVPKHYKICYIAGGVLKQETHQTLHAALVHP